MGVHTHVHVLDSVNTLIKVMNYNTLITYYGVYTYNSYELLLARFFPKTTLAQLAYCVAAAIEETRHHPWVPVARVSPAAVSPSETR